MITLWDTFNEQFASSLVGIWAMWLMGTYVCTYVAPAIPMSYVFFGFSMVYGEVSQQTCLCQYGVW